MPTYGLTVTGFQPKTLAVLLEEVKGELRSYFGTSLDLENGALARIIAIVCERYAELWELGEAVNTSQNPDAAAAAALDVICMITGTLRIEAAKSTVDLTLTGTPTTSVTSGQRVATLSTGVKFVTNETKVITAATAWAAATPYTVGARRTNASRMYQCITGGTSAGAGGPTTTSLDITDNTVHWRYLGEGTGVIDCAALAAETGPTIAVSGDITVIETPVGGWQSVVNLLDAKVGYDDQTDEALRVTRDEELSQAGTSTVDAIRAELLKLVGVVSVTVFENVEDVTNSDGMPPHSVEALVRGGSDTAIGNVLLAQVAAGITAHGGTPVFPVDSEGVAHEMAFTRPTEINIGVAITLTKDPAEYPADGDAQVEAAIVAFGNAQRGGKNAVSSSISAQAFKVPGVLDVTVCNISSVAAPGTPPGPTVPTTIAIALRELAVYDTSWITVTSSDGTP